jgi:hypothetical protein
MANGAKHFGPESFRGWRFETNNIQNEFLQCGHPNK